MQEVWLLRYIIHDLETRWRRRLQREEKASGIRLKVLVSWTSSAVRRAD
jgi:hypothetical protein